jgi:DNA-binding NtrC family response regulator
MGQQHIQFTLDQLGWNRSEAGRRLEITLPTLRAKIKSHHPINFMQLWLYRLDNHTLFL